MLKLTITGHCYIFLSLSWQSPYQHVPVTDRLLQPTDWSVNDSAGYVHGDVWHWEPEGFAALSLLTQANWWWDELRIPHGSSHGFGPPFLGRRQVRFVLTCASVVVPEPTTGYYSSIMKVFKVFDLILLQIHFEYFKFSHRCSLVCIVSTLPSSQYWQPVRIKCWFLFVVIVYSWNFLS